MSVITHNMKERPKCAIENCNNPAFVGWYGEWICGDCVMKIIEERRKMMKERLAKYVV